MIHRMLAIWSVVPLPFLNPIWKFLVCVLLKPNLKDFEHSLTSLQNEHKCMIVCTFFGISRGLEEHKPTPENQHALIMQFLTWNRPTNTSSWSERPGTIYETLGKMEAQFGPDYLSSDGPTIVLGTWFLWACSSSKLPAGDWVGVSPHLTLCKKS